MVITPLAFQGSKASTSATGFALGNVWFTEVVGLPPMQYLTRWRMQVAANRLRDTTAKVYAVANEVGYDSEEAFSRAFKRGGRLRPTRVARRRLNKATYSSRTKKRRRD